MKYIIHTNADINLSFDSSLMERGIIPVVSGVCICAMFQKELDHFSMAKGTSIVKRYEPSIIPGMDIGTKLQ